MLILSLIRGRRRGVSIGVICLVMLCIVVWNIRC